MITEIISKHIKEIESNSKYKECIEDSKSRCGTSNIKEIDKYIEFYGKETATNGDKYGKFFSNCVSALMSINGEDYASSEHYFQISKFVVDDDTTKIFASNKGRTFIEQRLMDQRNIDTMGKMTPVEVAKHGRSTREHPIRPDWDVIRDVTMYAALTTKFKIKEFREVLLSTDDKVIIERSPTDSYWAINDKGIGENRLGILLMMVRDDLSQ